MKTTIVPIFTEIRGKIDSITVQKRKRCFAISIKPVPYSKSGEERSSAQNSINAMYGHAVFDFRTAEQIHIDRWKVEAEILQISPFNFLIIIEIENIYDVAEFDFSHFV